MKPFIMTGQELLDNPKLQCLPLDTFGAKIKLLCLISQSWKANYLYHKNGDPYSQEQILTILRIPGSDWTRIRSELLEYGGMVMDENDALGFPGWAETQSSYYRRKDIKNRHVLQELLKYFGDKFQELTGDPFHCQFSKDVGLIKKLEKNYEKKYGDKTKDFLLDLIDVYFREIRKRINDKYNPNPTIGNFYVEIPRMIILLNEKRHEKVK